MRVAVIGATGRTGRLVVDRLLARGHEVVALVRDPDTAGLPDAVRRVAGDVRDRAALDALVEGVDAVLSALGPRKGDLRVHRDGSALLVEAMQRAGVRRFVGISGAGLDVPGDRKSRRDRVISALMNRLGGEVVNDKAGEYATWAASGLDWTLVRPPRLDEGPVAGRIEHAASHSPKRTRISRKDLADFLVHCVEDGVYVRAAPLVGAG